MINVLCKISVQYKQIFSIRKSAEILGSTNVRHILANQKSIFCMKFWNCSIFLNLKASLVFGNRMFQLNWKNMSNILQKVNGEMSINKIPTAVDFIVDLPFFAFITISGIMRNVKRVQLFNSYYVL